ncbi:response regulator [Paenibacillus thalictri]|uniref:response regulator n=1 Tax=Paenibacillus thalictri TaxID=2527873 RepID=UPI0013EEF96B|nr:response regulator [Paenibacillus thalictri]
MWKVLLVEDELFIRESIREIIAWEQYQFTLVGEAGNGKEALDMIEVSNPDLVITDIMMPEMDGLELLKTVRERGYACKFVMLTCLNDFHYAREALEYGASNYILKLSMSIKSLQETLLKVRKELEKSLQYDGYETSRYYEDIWHRLFDPSKPHAVGDYPAPPVREANRKWLRIFGILHEQADYSAAEFHSLKLLKQSERCIVHVFTRYGQTTVFIWSSEPIAVSGAAPATIIESALASVTAPTVGESGRLIVQASEMAQGARMAELWTAMAERMNAHWYAAEQADASVPAAGLPPVALPLSQPLLPPNSSQAGAEWYWAEETRFFQQFEQMRLDACLTLLDELWAALKRLNIGMAKVKELAVQMDKTLVRQARRQPESPDELWLAISADGLKQLLAARMERYMSLLITSVEKPTDHVEINKLKEYILKHYGSPITVRSMAAYVSLDETYLSNLFKQKTGETLIKYLHRIRVDKSKYDLTQTTQPIYEIAEKVGFVNVNYYNRIFKRMVGVTPSEYRTNHSSQLS